MRNKEKRNAVLYLLLYLCFLCLTYSTYMIFYNIKVKIFFKLISVQLCQPIIFVHTKPEEIDVRRTRKVFI